MARRSGGPGGRQGVSDSSRAQATAARPAPGHRSRQNHLMPRLRDDGDAVTHGRLPSLVTARCYSRRRVADQQGRERAPGRNRFSALAKSLALASSGPTAGEPCCPRTSRMASAARASQTRTATVAFLGFLTTSAPDQGRVRPSLSTRTRTWTRMDTTPRAAGYERPECGAGGGGGAFTEHGSARGASGALPPVDLCPWHTQQKRWPCGAHGPSVSGLVAHAVQRLLAVAHADRNPSLVAHRSEDLGLVTRKDSKFGPWVPQAQCSRRLVHEG